MRTKIRVNILYNSVYIYIYIDIDLVNETIQGEIKQGNKHTQTYTVYSQLRYGYYSHSVIECNIISHQRGRIEVLHDGVVSDRQVELVAAEDQAVVDGVPHQVDAGTHDERDDAQVHSSAWQRGGTSLHQLQHTPVTGPSVSFHLSLFVSDVRLSESEHSSLVHPLTTNHIHDNCFQNALH